MNNKMFSPLVLAVATAGVTTALFVMVSSVQAQVSQPVQNPQSGAVGVQGKISTPPPSQGASITIPSNGQSFTQLPIKVSGICPTGLLIKMFKNNVFAGSVQCENGSYSITVDLFSGQNDLIARVYDALDQAGPDSNTVSVRYNDTALGSASRVTLTSNFAKKGANPGQQLIWPIILSGGSGPYAISVDWGDGKAPDLMSQQYPGTFDIKHNYASSGVYNIIVKASDKNGGVAFLQLVGIANGPLSQDIGSITKDGGTDITTTKTRILWEPAAIMLPFIVSTFWLGKRYELHVLRKKIEQGNHPFK